MDFVSLFFNLDEYLLSAVGEYGTWIYAILFATIFLETGLVVAPFLPGDSLIFLAGALAGAGALNPVLLFAVMSVAAIAGDSVNYYIGRHAAGKMPYVKKEHIDATRAFYEKHGGKTIVLARFLPVIRTFAPFVAGMAGMKYRDFAFYNITGALLWVSSFLALGYFFGNVPIVKENIETVIVAIIALSVLPAIAGFLRSTHKR
ncbi:MAG: VTT domain-containing protein [Candidatus Aenigmarchaeota archaeon]|nr:VTT domain-containing protein [Candidatus Aenigmarchaeota archaeon]